MAEKRLESLKRRLMNNSELHRRYTQEMSKYVDEGYAELVPDDDIKKSEKIWYLPHHPVFNPKKPEKLRIVYDCAAEFQGNSLNKSLLQGPDLTNGLVGVLTRFREEKIAIVADIRGMFHQVKVCSDDRNALRFLWWRNGNLEEPALVYRMTVHLFGATSSPSCASFCLQQVVAQFGEGYSLMTCQAINRNFYVDDFLFSCSTTTEGRLLVTEVTEMLEKGGFQLTKWLSNDDDAASCIPIEAKGMANKSLPGTNCTGERVLGVFWDIERDCFRFTADFPEKAYTGRGIASMMHSLYDPLGFVVPLLVESKILLRDLNERDWDAPLTDDECKRWENWLKSVELLKNLEISRCLKNKGATKIFRYELHHFADASLTAFGTVSYLRTVETNTNIQCSFLIGKSFLAPAGLTIPKLELCAAVVAARMDELLRKELTFEINQTYLWTDSKAVLMCIRNKRRKFPIYIANRLAEIEHLTSSDSWHYVPSHMNPADEASRGLTAKKLLKNAKWLGGPEFLHKETYEWPNEIDEAANVGTILSSTAKNSNPLDKLIARYSSSHRLKVASAWILRIARRSKMKVAGSTEAEMKAQMLPHLTKEELDDAELRLIQYEQRNHLPKLYAALENGKTLNKTNCPQRLLNCNPKLVHNTIRLNGRIEKAVGVDYETRFPVVLPSDSHLTSLIIDKYHRMTGHGGINHTFNELRMKFWVECGSSTIRKSLKECMVCRKRKAKVGEQIMANLPEARLQINQPPFSHTGVDFFGPIYVKRGRSEEKRYGCIFTCMSTRAVHIEVAHSLTTESFLMALERFVARRRHVHDLYSDNGTNFIGAQRVIQEYLKKWNQKQIRDSLQCLDIEWHFNTPTASHFGGAWERLIRTVRKILNDISEHRVYDDENLRTVLTKVEAIMNSRPLTPVCFSELTDRALTPNEILTPGSDDRMMMLETCDRDQHSRNSWLRAQFVVNKFWERWAKEYLPTLAERSKWKTEFRNFQVDDVVVIPVDRQPRAQWPLGRVVDVHPDDKGKVRSVTLKTKDGSIKRPIAKLCMLIPNDVKTVGYVPSWLDEKSNDPPEDSNKKN